MDIDSNALRVFCAAFESKSFSFAARNLKISQPSVSQMISRLEEKFGNLLFERLGHGITPTRLAKELHQFSTLWLEQLDSFYGNMQSTNQNPKGKVRFAKPESCLWTPQYESILKSLRDLKTLSIDIEITTNENIIRGVLEDKYDFGFIIGERLSTELRFERFSEESYVAVQSSSLKISPSFSKEMSLSVITYPGWEKYFRIWADHHRFTKISQTWDLQPVVNVGNIAGALKAVVQGVGMAILPLQCISKELKEKRVHIVDPSSTKTYATSPVYLVKRRSYSPPRRVEIVLERLRTAKSGEL